MGIGAIHRAHASERAARAEAMLTLRKLELSASQIVRVVPDQAILYLDDEKRARTLWLDGHGLFKPRDEPGFPAFPAIREELR